MVTWIFTGVSGSERIEFLQELGEYISSHGKNVHIHDVGELIYNECRKNNIPIVDDLILDMDHSQLRLLRSLALKEVQNSILKKEEDYIHLVGIHATFRWKERLIPGISYQDVVDLNPAGFVNIIRDVKDIMQLNSSNPKWDKHTLPNVQETQEWMMVEEFATEILAEMSSTPIYLVSRNHHIDNVADLFLTNKKKIYLSYPITAVQQDEPELLEKIQGEILGKLEKLFIVFNPLSIEDMPLLNEEFSEIVPEEMEKLSSKAKSIIKARTIERDFQFIDQSDAVVVFYLTEKVSPGVLAEIYYAHRNQKPVFMVFPAKKSPFIEDAVSHIENDIDSLMKRLEDFAYPNKNI